MASPNVFREQEELLYEQDWRDHQIFSMPSTSYLENRKKLYEKRKT